MNIRRHIEISESIKIKFYDFLAIFSSEERFSDRLFFLALYLCLSFLPPLIAIISTNAVTAPFIVISVLVILRFFMRKNCRIVMINEFLSPVILLLFLLMLLLFYHAGLSTSNAPDTLNLLFKPILVFFALILLSFIASHQEVINKELLLKLAMIGFWSGLIITALKVIFNRSLGLGIHHNHTIMTSFLKIVDAINGELLILTLFVFIANRQVNATLKNRVFFISLYLFLFFISFLTIGFQSTLNSDMIMIQVASETVQFGIPLALLVFVLSWIKPRQMVHVVFASISFVLISAPWLFQFSYWIMKQFTYLPKMRQILMRGEIWDGSARRYLETRSFFGSGIESIKYGTELNLANDYMLTSKLFHPHNMFLQVWLDIGVVGVFLVLGLITLGWQFMSHIKRSYVPIMLSTLVMLSIVALVTHSLWQNWIIALFANVFILIMMISHQNRKQSMTKILFIFSLLIVLAGTFFITTEYLSSQKKFVSKKDPMFSSIQYWFKRLKNCKIEPNTDCDEIISQFAAQANGLENKNVIVNRKGFFSLYLLEDQLIYIKENCKPSDIIADLFPVNYYPKDINLVPEKRRKQKLPFFNKVEYFKKKGYRSESLCLLLSPLKIKANQIKKLQTGQFLNGKWQWMITWNFTD